MIRITVDVYSGRPDPVAVITDEQEAGALLRELEQVPGLRSGADPAAGLGPRGFRVEVLGDDLPATPAGGAVHVSMAALTSADRGVDIAARMLGLVEGASADAPESSAVDVALRDYLLGELAAGSARTVGDQAGARSDGEATAAVTCTIELGVFNPAFWNNDPTVRLNNNCYNYASNWRTDTFAQPGRGCGNQYHAITCAEVTRAAMCDGMHRRFDCFPDTEKPRPLVALVIAPSPSFNDFHWYRKQSDGHWGHKPGGTEARNVDNSGVPITNPETADRGPYTQFCGYFYGCNSQRHRIR